MMENSDVRWQQRFASYKKALAQLTKFIEKGELNELEEQGLIHSFQITFELAWHMISDFLVHQGNKDIHSSRDAIREAFNIGLIDDGDGWMNIYVDMNKTSHTYNEGPAKEIAHNVLVHHFPVFISLRQKMESIIDGMGYGIINLDSPSSS